MTPTQTTQQQTALAQLPQSWSQLTWEQLTKAWAAPDEPVHIIRLGSWIDYPLAY